MAEQLGLHDVTAIPVSALLGDNVIRPSAAMPWYRGPTLLDHLETVSAAPREGQPFRFAVQWINRDTGFRGYAGNVLGGSIQPGDEIVVLPSRRAQRAWSASSPTTAISTAPSPARPSR